MTLALLFLMGYQLWGDVAHEWAGAGMFLLFLLHHGLNAPWHESLFRGRYTPIRAAVLVVDVLLFLAHAGADGPRGAPFQPRVRLFAPPGRRRSCPLDAPGSAPTGCLS